MDLTCRGGFPGSGPSRKNYKYRRLSSIEKGSENHGYVSCDEDEDEIFTADNIELQKRSVRNAATGRSSSGSTPVKFITEYDQVVERPILKDESLRSISLKYRIPVSELKRINNIHKDSEFFALNSVKIPVKVNSLLGEMLDQEKAEQENLSEGNITNNARKSVLGTQRINSCSENEMSDSEMHVGYISINQILRDTKSKKEAQRFLRNMEKDLADIREKTKTYKNNLDEATDALTTVRFRALEEQKEICSGADWGISWWKILLGSIIILVGIPLIYVFYIVEEEEEK
ncbi:unnamed protein product, partial [Meganyctiphanes norvegica]